MIEVSRRRFWGLGLPAFAWRRPTMSRSRTADETPQETSLRQTLEERERQLAELELEVRKLQSTIKVHELEIRLLVGVNERNQQRVESETAEFAHRIGMTSGEPRRP